MTTRDWRPVGHLQQPIWEAVADELELTHRPGTVTRPPTIGGSLDGVHLHVTCTDDRDGNPPAKTIYKVTYRSLGAPIRIGQEQALRKVGIMARMIKIADVVDVEVGDKAFDKLAVIDAADVDTAKAFLTNSRREIITTLLTSKNMRNVVVTENSTTFETKKIEHKALRLTGNILGSVELARLLSKTQPGETRPVQQLRSFFDNDDTGSPLIQDQRR